ncbi:hypothetical protein [Mycolicibacterium hodleri]|nr:hypothetical protein [Mycolicibacterium hodleri]
MTHTRLHRRLVGVEAGPPATRVEQVPSDVVWAPDAGDEATWPAVADWAK